MNPDVAFRLDLNRSPCGFYPLDEKRVLIGLAPKDIVLSRHSTRRQTVAAEALAESMKTALLSTILDGSHWAFVHINDVQVFRAFGADADELAYRAFNDLLIALQTAGWADACCEGCNEPYVEDCTCEVVA